MCDAPVRKPHTHVLHTAPLLPGRDHSRSPSTPEHMCPPSRALSLWLHTFQVRTGDSRGCRRRCLALSVRAHRERFNGTILEFASLRLGCRFSRQAFRSRCARPFSPPPFTLTAAHPSPPAPPHVCRVQPKHPCITCRTHPAQAVPVPHPEHGDSRGVRRLSLARSLRAQRCRFNGAMHKFYGCRLPWRAAVCCGV